MTVRSVPVARRSLTGINPIHNSTGLFTPTATTTAVAAGGAPAVDIVSEVDGAIRAEVAPVSTLTEPFPGRWFSR
jgi:hypothetical protein